MDNCSERELINEWYKDNPERLASQLRNLDIKEKASALLEQCTGFNIAEVEEICRLITANAKAGAFL